MDQLLNFLLTQILVHGYPIVFGAILLAYIGVPVPLNVLILAAGAFTKDDTLSIYVLIPLVSISAIIGDLIQYYLGKRFGFLLINKYTAKLGLTQKRLQTVTRFLDRWGASCIFTSRCIFTAFGNPVNFIAGINEYSFKSFFIWCVIGEVIWASSYIYLGYLFGTNWVTLLDYIQNAPAFTAFVLMGLLYVFIGYKIWRKKSKKAVEQVGQAES